jgi:hypothetical protein
MVMNTQRIMGNTVVTVALVAGLQVAGTQAAWADASGQASCVGLESSSVTPPGTSDEFPGGRAQLSHVINGLAGELGVSPGAIVSSVARLHEGSHEACDEATG